jgi:sugar diacid utilization regulator
MGTRNPSFRAAIIQGMQDQLDELVSEVVHRIRKHIPEYAEIKGLVLADVKAGVERNTTMVLAALEDQRQFHSDELTAIRANGARRCEQDLPLDSLIEAIRLGIKTGMDWATKQAYLLPDPGNLAPSVLSQLHQDFLDLFHDVAVVSREGYMEHKAHRRAKLKERTELFQEVLAGAYKTEATICTQATALGYDLLSPHGLVLLTAAKPDTTALEKAASALASRLPAAVGLPPVTHPSPHASFIVPASSPDTWPNTTAAAKALLAEYPLLALVCLPVAGPKALGGSYQNARELIAVAWKVYGPHALVEAGDLLVFAVIQAAGPEKLHRLVEDTLGPILALPNSSQAKLLDSIDAMHRHPRTKAAKILKVSLRTLNNRLNRIAELTKLRLEDPSDRLRLDLALYALRVVQE